MTYRHTQLDNRDENESDIIAEFARTGASCFRLRAQQKGFPDLLLCYNGTFALVEVKQEGKPLKPEQAELRDWFLSLGYPWFLADHIYDCRTILSSMQALISAQARSREYYATAAEILEDR